MVCHFISTQFINLYKNNQKITTKKNFKIMGNLKEKDVKNSAEKYAAEKKRILAGVTPKVLESATKELDSFISLCEKHGEKTFATLAPHIKVGFNTTLRSTNDEIITLFEEVVDNNSFAQDFVQGGLFVPSSITENELKPFKGKSIAGEKAATLNFTESLKVPAKLVFKGKNVKYLSNGVGKSETQLIFLVSNPVNKISFKEGLIHDVTPTKEITVKWNTKLKNECTLIQGNEYILTYGLNAQFIEAVEKTANINEEDD